MITRNNKPSATIGGHKNDVLNDESVRKSSRFQPSVLHIETHSLGELSTRINISEETILDFIDKNIKSNEPVIVSLPISPERHAFLVVILTKQKKIMIADWFLRDIDKITDKNWVIYVKFMNMIKEKYSGYKIDFFPVDKQLHKCAKKHHTKNRGSGGCSYYIYKWIQKHNDELKQL